MLRLPNDTLLEIFVYLPNKGPVFATCSRFRDLIDKRFPPTTLRMPPFTRPNSKSTSRRIRILCTQLSAVLLSRKWTRPPGVKLRGGLEVKFLQALAETMNGCGVEQLTLYRNPFLQGITPLQTLKRVDYSGNHAFNQLASLLASCPLEDLTYHPTKGGFHEEYDFEHLSLLSHLQRLTLWLRIDPEEIFETWMMGASPTLESLCIVPLCLQSDISFDDTVMWAPNLKELTLGNEWSLENGHSINLECCKRPPPYLRSLRVYIESRKELSQTLDCDSLLNGVERFEVTVDETSDDFIWLKEPWIFHGPIKQFTLRQLGEFRPFVEVLSFADRANDVTLEKVHLQRRSTPTWASPELHRLVLKECQLEDSSVFEHLPLTELSLENCCVALPNGEVFPLRTARDVHNLFELAEYVCVSVL